MYHDRRMHMFDPGDILRCTMTAGYDRALASKFFPADACNFIRVPFPANPSGYKPYGNHQTLRESTTASEEPFFGLIEQAEVLFDDRIAR